MTQRSLAYPVFHLGTFPHLPTSAWIHAKYEAQNLETDIRRNPVHLESQARCPGSQRREPTDASRSRKTGRGAWLCPHRNGRRHTSRPRAQLRGGSPSHRPTYVYPIRTTTMEAHILRRALCPRAANSSATAFTNHQQARPR